MDQNSIDDWYTAGRAAEVMSKNNDRHVGPAYLRSLARLGKIKTKKIGNRTTLYLKEQVDAYKVEERGAKVARAQKARFGKIDKEENAA